MNRYTHAFAIACLLLATAHGPSHADEDLHSLSSLATTTDFIDPLSANADWDTDLHGMELASLPPLSRKRAEGKLALGKALQEIGRSDLFTLPGFHANGLQEVSLSDSLWGSGVLEQAIRGQLAAGLMESGGLDSGMMDTGRWDSSLMETPLAFKNPHPVRRETVRLLRARAR